MQEQQAAGSRQPQQAAGSSRQQQAGRQASRQAVIIKHTITMIIVMRKALAIIEVMINMFMNNTATHKRQQPKKPLPLCP